MQLKKWNVLTMPPSYRSALEKLVQDNTSYTDGMRKRLTKAARCAISMRSRESDKKLGVKQLREDLHNGPVIALEFIQVQYRFL